VIFQTFLGLSGHTTSAATATAAMPCVEYARSDKSTCRGCSEGIAKGAARIGLDGGRYISWYHVQCAEKPKSLKSVDRLQGFDTLETNDRGEVEAWFNASAKKKRSRAEIEKDAVSFAAVEPKKLKLGELHAKLLAHGIKVSSDWEGDKETLVELFEEAIERSTLDAEYQKLSVLELKELLKLNRQYRAGTKPELISLCIEGALYGALPECPGVDGQEDCHSGLVFYPPKEQPTGHGGLGRYQCLGGYGTATGYTRCPFVTVGSCPSARNPWKAATKAELAKLAAART